LAIATQYAPVVGHQDQVQLVANDSRRQSCPAGWQGRVRECDAAVMSASSFADALPITGLALAIAGVALICVNLRHARRIGPQSGATGIARALGSWVVVIAGFSMILIGIGLLLAPAAAI
jgi:hypothetical protein